VLAQVENPATLSR